MDAIARLLRPDSVAVIGASADPTKMTGRPVGYLQKHGFAGAIYPVNPRAASIGELPCYPDVAALPEAPDVGLVLVGPERAEQAVRDLAARGTAAAIVLASGYGEASPDGARRQQALREAAGPMRLLGPNTIGLVNLTDGIMLSATGALEVGELPPGRISLVSQSGGILGSLLSRAADRGIGFAKLVSTGNEGDLDSADFVEHLVEDDATAVIAVYMEGLRRPDAFRRAAQRAAACGKPIVVFKVGRSESGARAASSHTGALAGADRMYDAFFRQLGVIRAETFADLLDIPGALACGRRAAGRRVAVLTSTGGAGTLVADACGLAGFEVPPPDAATVARLAALQEGGQAAADRNPVDVTLAGLQPTLFRTAIDALLDSPGYDALVTIVGSSALAQPDLVADAVVECQARSEKPVLAYVSPHAPHIIRLLNQ
ncbi:MAG TPA: CoA-binding protein, partial [Acetobacteraceae bacterium]|nr:CoA-binding protein [Acetobacteraceae bacterium]